MSWIKINITLPRSAKIHQLARHLNCTRQTALGIAIDWLTWLDIQTEDGASQLTADEVDNELGVAGAAVALKAIGWVKLDEWGYVVASEFDKHNGSKAKKKAQTARRVINHREQPHMKPTQATAPKLRSHEQRLVEQSLTPTKETAPHTKSISLYPANAKEVESYLRSQPHCQLEADELSNCAEKFYNGMESCGWVNKNGNPIRKWQPLAQSYMSAWLQNLQQRKTPSTQTTDDYAY